MSDLFAAAFYRFVPLPDFRELREPLLAECERLALKGTVLLAPEGVNGTLSGTAAALERLLEWLRCDPRLAPLQARLSPVPERPFLRLKVRLKREIISLGLSELDPVGRTGEHVSAREWNALISDHETLLIDTRNGYEVATGTFKRAVDPGLARFRDFPDYVRRELSPERHKRVAMFCTGGIRCEKAAAYMLAQGFEEVYQLQGGILAYLEQVPEAESLWEGECFVFDERVTVGHGLSPGAHSSCHGCRHPLSPADRASPDYREGVHCPYCRGQDPAREARAAARWEQVRLARERGMRHLGVPPAAQQGAPGGTATDE